MLAVLLLLRLRRSLHAAKPSDAHCCNGPNYGGWFAVGYYTNNDPLSTTDNDLLSFWDNPDDVNYGPGLVLR